MDLLFENRLWQINLFIFLTFIIQTSCTVSLSVLKEMCCIDSGLKIIQSLPPNNNCTAIAWYSAGKSTLDDINHLNRNMKKVYIYNNLAYDDYRFYLSPSRLDEFLIHIRKRIADNNIDVFIFEGIFRNPSKTGYNNLVQMDIRRLILKLKKTNPNTLCGIFFRFLPDIGVNLQYLEKVVPFFVLRSFDNHRCYHRDDQNDMDHIDPVEEIEEKVKGILSIINGKKLCIGIQIIVESTKKSYAKQEEDDTYSNGTLIPKYNLAGAFILSLDFDDALCKCGCGCYPVMTAINAGIQNLPEPQVTNCSTWTLLKRKRNN